MKPRRKPPPARWSRRVTQTSKALDLEPGVFTFDDPRRIARSLKRSAEASRRRKSSPYRSAMSMLTFYINRAGRGLSRRQRIRLERAKDELRSLYGRGRIVEARRSEGSSPGPVGRRSSGGPRSRSRRVRPGT